MVGIMRYCDEIKQNKKAKRLQSGLSNIFSGQSDNKELR